MMNVVQQLIESKLLCVVQVNAFINQFQRINNIIIPTSLMDLILFMYAHPIVINFKYRSETKNILLCCITDNWNSIQSRIKSTFPKLSSALSLKLYYESAGARKYVFRPNCNNTLNINVDKTFGIDPMWPDSVIDRIDDGLGKYYEKFGRNDYDTDGGKFKVFCEDAGYEEYEIQDELLEEPCQCTLVEFDMDNNFPLQEGIDDEVAKIKEIHRILNDIAKYGAPIEVIIEHIELNVDICADLNDSELIKFASEYTSQMSSLPNRKGKDVDLRWYYYLAVSSKLKYPFLTYMIDSFTKDKAELYARFRTCNYYTPSPLTLMTVVGWTHKNTFFIALRCKYPQKANQLQSAMINYSNRIMSRLQFESTYKIDDIIQKIAEYIVAVPKFIKNTLLNQNAVPPFQVDLLIAVNQVIAQFDSENDDDDDDEDDNESVDPNIEHIGFVQNEFNNLKPDPIYYTPLNDKYEINDEKDDNERMETLTRILGDRYNDFRTVLSGGSNNDDNSKKIYGGKKSKYFDARTYPSGRRFSIFIDRRKKKPTGGNMDEMTMFEPPNGCNLMGKDHVPEIGFEFLRKCILPKGNGKHVTATDGLCGQLLTFMFNVEAKDEIKCYIVWNGQTMRFHGDHIGKILPNIFIQSNGNNNFENTQEAKNLEREFDTYVNDIKYEKFYLALKHFKS